MIRALLFSIVLSALPLFALGCGKSEANGISATIVPGPAGVTCYAILNGAGDPVGGNCQ